MDERKKCGTMLTSLEGGQSLLVSKKEKRGMLEDILSDMERLVEEPHEFLIRVRNQDMLIRLEETIWVVLEEISRKERVDVYDLCEQILLDKHNDIAAESVLRAYTVDYLRKFSMGEYSERKSYVEH